MADEWSQWLQEYLIDTGNCYAAGLAQTTDHVIYAAAPVAGDEGWNKLYAEPGTKRPITQDDGTTKDIEITESEALRDALAWPKGGNPPYGLWIGGIKYQLSNNDEEFELENGTVKWVFAAGKKSGAHIIATEKNVIIALYDEEKGQVSGNCKSAAVDFAKYLKSEGL